MLLQNTTGYKVHRKLEAISQGFIPKASWEIKLSFQTQT